MDYDVDSCVLQRLFGEEGRQAYLELRAFGGLGTDLQVTIASKDFDVRHGEFKVAVQPFEEEATERSGFNIRLNSEYDGKMFSEAGFGDPETADELLRSFVSTAENLTSEQRALVLRGLDSTDNERIVSRLKQDPDYLEAVWLADQAFEGSQPHLDHLARTHAATEGILIEQAFSRDLFIRTGQMGTAMAAMRTCLDELMSHWEIDVAAHRSLSRKARPLNFQDLARRMQQNYPREMVRQGLAGYLNVRLSVSAEGQPTACHLQTPINHEVFEREACEGLMRHAKFSPALDAAGQPIASYYQTSILYMLD